MRYDYKCEKCGVFEVVKRMSDPDPKACPTCGGVIVRVYEASPILYANRPPWTYKESLKYKTCSHNGGPKFNIDPSKHGDIGAWNSPGELAK
jgi:putative FmdB family regulatory protein